MKLKLSVIGLLLSVVFIFTSCSVAPAAPSSPKRETTGDVQWIIGDNMTKIPENSINVVKDEKFKKGINVLGINPDVNTDARNLKGYLDYFGNASVIGDDDGAEWYNSLQRKRAWELTQWYSKENLESRDKSTDYFDETTGEYIYSNKYKTVKFNPEKGSATLAAKCGEEYGYKAKTMGNWTHLLLEQSRIDIRCLRDVNEVNAYIDFEITEMKNQHLDGSYNKNLHAAQLVWYFVLANIDGGAIWFGILLYDNRLDRARPQERDGYDFHGGFQYDKGTNMMIYSLDPYSYFGTEGPTTGKRYKCIIPMNSMIEKCVEEAKKVGIFPEKTSYDRCVFSGMNIGWEIPGTFDVSATFNHIGLYMNPKY